MVTLTEDQVYKILSYQWRSGEELLEDLQKELGLTDLKLTDKLGYWMSFQSPEVSEHQLNTTLHKLVKKGYADLCPFDYQRDGEKKVKLAYRKSKTGKPIGKHKIPLLPLNLEEMLFPTI